MKHLLKHIAIQRERITRVLIGDQLEFSPSKEKRIALITDSNVEKIVARPLEKRLRTEGHDVLLLVFPAGEPNKTRETKQMLEDQLLAQRFGRDTLIVGVGGGVVCDMAAYLAATYMRGVSLVLVPTTLLAMVDASIGGKCGVNVRQGKNLVGAFYPAEEVAIDLSLLESLPENEVVTGCAEMIKMGLVASKELFYLMAERGDDIHFWMRAVRLACTLKTEVVETDLLEAGRRRILNFGHTIGHAVELLEEYQISHGQAVAIGMVVESFLSVKMGLLPFEKWNEVMDVLKKYPFSFALSSPLDYETVSEVLVSDKKSLNQTPRFALLSGIGNVAPFDGEYCSPVESEMLREALCVVNELCVFP